MPATTIRANRAPKWQARFLAQLREAPSVTHACAAAGVPRRTVYDYRTALPEFAQAWDEAIEASVDALVVEAFTRAKISDTLLIFLLKSHRPEVYRETIRLDVFAEARRLAAEYNLSEEDAVAEAERITRLHA